MQKNARTQPDGLHLMGTENITADWPDEFYSWNYSGETDRQFTVWQILPAYRQWGDRGIFREMKAIHRFADCHAGMGFTPVKITRPVSLWYGEKRHQSTVHR